MTTITMPSDFVYAHADYSIEYDVQMDVARSGKVDTYGLPGARWVVTIGFPDDYETLLRPRFEAFIASLRGGARDLSFGYIGRPVPNGTLTGSPTVGTATAKGDNTIALANCNGTLRAGDIIGVGSEMFMVEDDATPVSSAMTVKVSPAVRSINAVGTAVVWNNPKILWVPRSSVAGPFPFVGGAMRPGFAAEFVERG